MKISQKFRIELPHKLNYSIFGIYPKNTKDINLKYKRHNLKNMHPCVPYIIIYNSQDMETKLSVH